MAKCVKKKARVEEEEEEEEEENEESKSDAEVFQVEYFKGARVDEDSNWVRPIRFHHDLEFKPVYQEYLVKLKRGHLGTSGEYRQLPASTGLILDRRLDRERKDLVRSNEPRSGCIFYHLLSHDRKGDALGTFERVCPATINRGTLGTEQDPSLKVIFIHVNAKCPGPGRGNIRGIPGLSLDTDSKRRERSIIWHIGGTATFTAVALLSGPLGISKRILHIEEHDCWVSCIMPAVIGMAVSTVTATEYLVQKRIACNALQHEPHHTRTQSPIEYLDEDGASEMIPCTCEGFAYEWLLDAIDEESTPVVGAPPLHALDPDLQGYDTSNLQPCRPRNGCQPGKPNVLEQDSDHPPASVSSVAPFTNALMHTTLDQAQGRPLPLSFYDNFIHPGRADTGPHLCLVTDVFGGDVEHLKRIRFKQSCEQDPFETWALSLFDNEVCTRSEIIQEFKRLCGNVPQEEWQDVIKKEIVEELGRTQVSERILDDSSLSQEVKTKIFTVRRVVSNG
ncbi:hypothetical protein FB446DRAFT_794463 [Lentinula raphanica]|nr:hypothetical protein FB446DRAFT_794463 [Lentinula raphanica]